MVESYSHKTLFPLRSRTPVGVAYEFPAAGAGRQERAAAGVQPRAQEDARAPPRRPPRVRVARHPAVRRRGLRRAAHPPRRRQGAFD
jgi:hypothetical protein